MFSINITNVYTPINKIQFYIINTNIFFLFYLVDINKLEVYYNNIQDILVTYTKEYL
jgi:hypothetical protein